MDFLGCDDLVDAVRSLAVIYRVDVDDISVVVNGGWPDFMVGSQESYQDIFRSDLIPVMMGHHLRSVPSFDLGEIAYYHRTSYDGADKWFVDGLLSSIPAAHAFFEKVNKLVVIDGRARELSLKNIQERNCFEGFGAGGPYAFDVFDDAKAADRPGLDYTLPEFFCGEVWRQRDGFGLLQDLRQKLQMILKPVVVKFIARTEASDQYITNLWHYVFRKYQGDVMSGCSHYPCTFVGKGVDVAFDKIIKIIDL